MAGAALGEMQFEFLTDLWRNSILKVVSELGEEFIAGDHMPALSALAVK